MKHAFAAVCAYEVLAILTGRAPTITACCGRRPWLGVVLVAALAGHFALEAEKRTV